MFLSSSTFFGLGEQDFLLRFPKIVMLSMIIACMICTYWVKTAFKLLQLSFCSLHLVPCLNFTFIISIFILLFVIAVVFIVTVSS